ncbi:PQQ-like beta-propeller repeat protein [Flammeovirga sp. SubArs3]|uniref:PQQ-binding-like beta-propeller repeat protein n=1 Tax=Flammeovirga sp. SubArs3 TaxID=2995316 RepID=UPI00248A979C|nr:PQQ-like beta-propeller repeat protein [Flammeovirga sp. SubArs3]
MKSLFSILIITIYSSVLYGQTSLVWEYKLSQGVYSSPVIDNNVLFIGSNDSSFYALDKSNGQLFWKYRTKGELKSQPLVYKESVIFNSTDGFIYSVNKNTGQLIWRFATEGEKRKDIWDYYLSSPIISEDKLFIGSGDGHLYTLNPYNGELIWKHKTGGIIHANPLVYQNKVFIGSFDGFFYALNVENGELIWKFKTIGDEYFPNGEIQKGATIYKNSIIFGSRDYNIYSLNIDTGRGMWNRKEKGSWVVAEPLIVDDIVYFGTSDSHRFCGLNASNGYDKYSLPLNMRVYGKAVFYDGEIYFGCFNGKLYKFNIADEELSQVFQTHGSENNYFNVYNKKDEFVDGFNLYDDNYKEAEEKILSLGAILSTPIVDNQVIYFGDSNGYIYAYKLKELE